MNVFCVKNDVDGSFILNSDMKLSGLFQYYHFFGFVERNIEFYDYRTFVLSVPNYLLVRNRTCITILNLLSMRTLALESRILPYVFCYQYK